MPDPRFARDCRFEEICERHAIENILARRKIVQGDFGDEVAFGQRIGESAVKHGLERIGRRHLDNGARRPVGPAPKDGGATRHIARLQPMRKPRPVGGAADARRGDGACQGEAGGGRRFKKRAPA